MTNRDVLKADSLGEERIGMGEAVDEAFGWVDLADWHQVRY